MRAADGGFALRVLNVGARPLSIVDLRVDDGDGRELVQVAGLVVEPGEAYETLVLPAMAAFPARLGFKAGKAFGRIGGAFAYDAAAGDYVPTGRYEKYDGGDQHLPGSVS